MSVSPNVHPPVPDTPTLCPACGYDLRAATDARCPECGLQIDVELMRVSGIPWAHRATVGRLRAYCRTAYQFTFAPAALHLETARPQDPRDSVRFRRTTAALLAAAFVAFFALAIVENGAGYAVFAVEPSMSGAFPAASPVVKPWIQDTLVPWSAGATLLPVFPVCLILLAFLAAAAPHAVCRAPASATQDQRLRARALAGYLAAPLLIFFPALAVFALALLISHMSTDRSAFALAATLVAFTIFLMAIAFTLIRTAQWTARIRHCTFARAALSALELLALWTATILLCTAILPWSLGLLWIAFDSLRR
jgi:hypothetical protein